MGKILGKSALCFAGLAVISWMVQKLTDWLFFIEKSPFLTLLNLTIFAYIFWLLVGAAYVYILFLLFGKKKHCCLIILLHGIFLILQSFLLLLLCGKNILPRSDEVLRLSLIMSNVYGLPTILLAAMFTSLKDKSIKACLKNRTLNALIIIAKSALCFSVLAAVSYGFDKLHNYFTAVLGIVGFIIDNPLFVLPIYAIVYAYGLYRFFQQQARRRLLLILNAVFLMLTCGLMLLFVHQLYSFGRISPIQMTIFLGNTAIITIVFAFVFRSVEKRKAALPATQNAPDADSIPVHPDMR